MRRAKSLGGKGFGGLARARAGEDLPFKKEGW